MSARMDAGRGATVWLTGLPGAGKSSIGRALAVRLRAARGGVEVLDGDEVRARISPRLGLDRADRDEHVRRIGYIALLLARNGVVTIVAAIAPYAKTRDDVRRDHDVQAIPFFEVFVATSVTECERRDPKGLYRAYREGRITALTGVDAPYEEPSAPELRADTERHSIDEIVEAIFGMLAPHITRT